MPEIHDSSMPMTGIKQSDMPTKRTPQRMETKIKQQNRNKLVRVTTCRACHDFRTYRNCFSSRFRLENRFAPCACTIRIPVRMPVPCASQQTKTTSSLCFCGYAPHKLLLHVLARLCVLVFCDVKCFSNFLVVSNVVDLSCSSSVESSNSSSFHNF